MLRRTPLTTSLLGTALLCAACGGAGYARTANHEGNWAGVKEGNTVLLYAGDDKCETTHVGASQAELKAGGGKLLSAEPWSKSVTAWSITESYAEDIGEYSPDVYLHLKEVGTGKELWVYSTSATNLACVHPGQEGVTEAKAMLGKRYVFAPYQSGCSNIVAGGSKFVDLIGKAPAGTAYAADRLGLGDSSLVIALDGGALAVTPETLSTCFADENSAAAKAPDDLALALLRVSPGRCEKDVHDGKVHQACRSTLGAWQADASGLHAVRRTFGPLHLLDGQPVSGRRFARAVVAIDTGLAQSPRETTLYTAVRDAASRIIQQGDDNVRIAPSGDPTVTTAVKIVVRDITIGDLQTAQKQETSKYKVSERQVPNPAKADGMRQVQEAEQLVQNKRSECDSMSDTDYSAQQTCVDNCVANSAGSSAALCGFTCKDAGGSSGAKSDCLNAVSEAENQVNQARAQVNDMPDTLTETVWGDWNYTRTEYARKVTAVIETTSTSPVGERKASDNLEFVASDYQIAADSAHNVSGHDPRRDFIDSPESIVPSLAEKASGVAIERLKQSLQIGAVDAALLALKRSGATPRPGYEYVDAMAYDVVGKRLGKSESYGDGANPIDLSSITLADGECALVVAASSDAGSATALKSDGGSFADERGRPFATLELCKSEIGGKLPKIEVGGSSLKYGVYRTRESQ